MRPASRSPQQPSRSTSTTTRPIEVTPDLERRLMAKVSPEPTSGCWLWTGSVNTSGYGQIGRGGKDGSLVLVHRASYEIHRGPIPKGMVLDHLCRCRTCVNPAHLEVVTNRENIRRGVSPIAKHMADTCCRGHQLDEANLRVELKWKKGMLRESRHCLRCERDNRAARAARRTQEAA